MVDDDLLGVDQVGFPVFVCPLLVLGAAVGTWVCCERSLLTDLDSVALDVGSVLTLLVFGASVLGGFSILGLVCFGGPFSGPFGGLFGTPFASRGNFLAGLRPCSFGL